MTNCKSCQHRAVCKNLIDDGKTYNICENYLGACLNCKNTVWLFGKWYCKYNYHYCIDTKCCGLWEEQWHLKRRTHLNTRKYYRDPVYDNKYYKRKLKIKEYILNYLQFKKEIKDFILDIKKGGNY